MYMYVCLSIGKYASHTLTSMSPILLTARIIGRPTIDGKMCAGKLLPAYPHFTNCR